MATPNKIGAALASVGLLTDVDTAQRNSLGLRVQDDSGNEYVYLTGVASTAANDWVFFDELYLTVRAVTSSVHGPMAIAQAATVASNFGWYCVFGYLVVGNCISDTFTDDSQAFLTGTAGSVDDESGGAGTSIYGAISRTQGASTSTNFQIVYPFNLGSDVV
jgi:hypothetical protein